ncbi:sulfotransferase 4 isoform X2 [Musca autumnalis]|uniref:sulfotransferase 4 isoform X2 n=1 Tax=Musca autumnalis TaxID=221902 RepID=UPI003CEADA1C
MTQTFQNKKFPYEINLLSAEKNKELLQYFHGEKTGFVQVGPEKYFFPFKYKNEAENYYNFQARPNDVWVVTFPRSGTTWTQELVWLLCNKLDFHAAKEIKLTERFPFFEFHLFVHPDIKKQILEENSHSKEHQEFVELISTPGYKLLSEIPQTKRRFIKTHFPLSLLPHSVMELKCKIIYVARNPMDVAVSYYYLNRLYRTQGYIGNFERFWNYFQESLNPWMPYFSHIREAMNFKNSNNFLYLQYEDMSADLQSSIKQLANFLECDVDETKMEALLQHLHISNFRSNTSVNGQEMIDAHILNKNENGFVRTGMTGSSIVEFQTVPGLFERANEWVNEQVHALKNQFK